MCVLMFLCSNATQAVSEALDVYEGQLKDFVAKQHFRHDQMQSAFTAAKTKWTETNDRTNIKLCLLNLTIVFFGSVKKVCSHLYCICHVILMALF